MMKAFIFAVALTLSGALAALAQQPTGTLLLHGQVKDQFGAVIVGAAVTVSNPSGIERTASTNNEGDYAVLGLTRGAYTVRVTSSGFAAFEKTNVVIDAGSRIRLDITLSVALLEGQQVTVGAKGTLSTAPENNAGAITLRGTDLNVIPDDPEELAAALQALAGPPVGPSGGQILIDGFTNTGQPLPPRESIREIRINENPFSAENDRVGFGQIQILTRAGTDKWRGGAAFDFSDEAFNSRNPFAGNRAPYQLRLLGGTLSGSIVPKRASLFLSVNHRQVDDNAVVNATVLDAALTPTMFSRAVLTPLRTTAFNLRADMQINNANTLSARYAVFRFERKNSGVGSFSLPERAYTAAFSVNSIQLTETAILSPKLLNEIRLEYIFEDIIERGDNSRPTVDVLQAFTAGGSYEGLSTNPEKRLWLQDNITWASGTHTIRSGARFRRATLIETSTYDFGGTFTFAGGPAPQLDANNQLVRDANNQIAFVPITSLERYRRTLLFGRQGLTASEIRQRGGGATQFSIGTGNPEARADQLDFSLFVEDTWRIRPSLALSAGLRYELQSNISNKFNLAPRLAMAWAPGTSSSSTGQAQTVVRGGFGIFYDRFNENQVLVANRYNGINQQRFIVSESTVLGSFPAVPTLEAIRAATVNAQTIRRIAPDLREPYTIQSAISLERQLPYRTTLTATFVNARTLHALRTRNINAPLPGTFVLGEPGSGVRPFGSVGNILQYESSGRLNQNQLLVVLNNRLSSRLTFFSNYTLNRALGDTEGVGSYPANSYDFGGEYGRLLTDVRHSFSLGGTFDVGFGFRLNPLVFASSGRPFNITTGRDTNGDTVFAERPALAADLTKRGIVLTSFGAFDPNPIPSQKIIPRNFGNGPNFFAVNLNVSRTFGFGDRTGTVAGSRSATNEKRYQMAFSVRALNLFNHTNANTPVGNLSSPLFNQSILSAGAFGGSSGNPSAGNRRIEAQVRFSF